MTIVDADGRPIDAVIPLEIQVVDARGELREHSGHYGAKDGKVDLTLDIPTNAAAGSWKIQARDLASGTTGEATIAVE